MIENFPVKGNPSVDGRLIANSIATCKYRIYGLTDICVFGLTRDVERFFFYEDEEDIIKNYNFPKNRLINVLRLVRIRYFGMLIFFNERISHH